MSFQIYIYFFPKNIVSRAGDKDFLHLLQAIFTYAFVIDWKLNLGFIIYETTQTLIPKLSKPQPKLAKLSPVWGDHYGDI